MINTRQDSHHHHNDNRHSDRGRSGDGRPSDRPAPNIVQSERFDTGRKTFFLDLIENERGQVVRITEDVRGRRDRIMVPHEALDDLIAGLERLKTGADQRS